MTEKEKQLGTWLSQIADELNITPTMLDKAVKATLLWEHGFPTASPTMSKSRHRDL